MEHQNCCTDLRHPELLAACCPYSSVHGKLVVQHRSKTKKVGKLPPLRSFSFLTLRDIDTVRAASGKYLADNIVWRLAVCSENESRAQRGNILALSGNNFRCLQ
jgi:hypothetical protein